MRLKREQVGYLTSKITTDLLDEKYIKINKSDIEMVNFMVEDFVLEQLLIEDKLNEEVRNILEQHRTEMYQEGVNYQEMFKMIKRRLIEERNLVI